MHIFHFIIYVHCSRPSLCSFLSYQLYSVVICSCRVKRPTVSFAVEPSNFRILQVYSLSRQRNSTMPSEDSYKQIEGEWKDFRFRRVTPGDCQAVCEHISNNFTRDEPTSKLLGWSQAYADDVNRLVEKFIKDELSFIAEHKATGIIAGLRITYKRNPAVTVNWTPPSSTAAKLMMKLYGDVSLADVTNKFGIDEWAELFIASTDPEFRNQGLAGELYDRSLAFLKAAGFKHALVMVTSPYTKMATKRRGFEQLSRLDYENFMDFDGKPAFSKDDLTSDHFAMVMFKIL